MGSNDGLGDPSLWPWGRTVTVSSQSEVMKNKLWFKALRPIQRHIAAQLSRPSGWFGRTVMHRMLNRGNRELITSAVSKLELQPDDSVIDIGFGGGLALDLALRSGVSSVLGVDPSQTSCDAMQKQLPRQFPNTMIDIRCGSAEALPFAAASIRKAISTNTVYFMKAPQSAFVEIFRVLEPRGRVVIGFSGAEKLRAFEGITQHGFFFHSNSELQDTFREAGFADVELEALSGRNTKGDFLLSGTKPAL